MAWDVDAHPAIGEHEEFGRDVALEEDVLTRWGRHLVDDLGHALEVERICAAEEVGLLEHGGDLFPVHVWSLASLGTPAPSHRGIHPCCAQAKRWARAEREPTAAS